MMLQLEVTLFARAELVDIRTYSETRFGRRTAAEYIGDLTRTFELLCHTPRLGKPYGAKRDKLFRFRKRQHFIYYTFTDTRLTIARVVHVSQNQRKALRR